MRKILPAVFFERGKKMNKKQTFCLWLGIIFIAYPIGAIIAAGEHTFSTVILPFVLWSLAVLLVTAGLIYALKDKPKPKEKEGTEE
jgi:hypothetical protein